MDAHHDLTELIGWLATSQRNQTLAWTGGAVCRTRGRLCVGGLNLCRLRSMSEA